MGLEAKVGQKILDGEINQMALPSRHSIRNLSPGNLSSSTLPHGDGALDNNDDKATF